MNQHPLPYISELKNLVCIKDFSDVLKVMDFVYSIVPSMSPPYYGNYEEGLPYFYENFQKKEIGGWCSLNVDFFNMILKAYNIKCGAFNYGSQKKYLTHMVSIVSVNDQRFLVDVFFNKYYVNRDNNYLTFDEFAGRLILRDFDDIVPVYGELRKPTKYIPNPLERSGSERKNWINYLPEVFEQKVLDNFGLSGLDKLLEKKFNSNNPFLLMLLPTWKTNNLRYR